MKYIDLTANLNEYHKNKERVIGRYRASELYFLLKEPPENYFKPKNFTMEEMIGMWRGTMKHKGIQDLLTSWEHEKPNEIDYGGFVLRAKCDCYKPDTILEIKTKRNGNVMDKASSWQIFQLRTYLGMYQVPWGKVVQPVILGGKLKLKVLAEVAKNDKWYQDVIEQVREYHNKLVKLYGNKND